MLACSRPTYFQPKETQGKAQVDVTGENRCLCLLCMEGNPYHPFAFKSEMFAHFSMQNISSALVPLLLVLPTKGLATHVACIAFGAFGYRWLARKFNQG